MDKRSKLNIDDPQYAADFHRCSEQLAALSLPVLLADYESGTLPPVLGPLTYEQVELLARWISLATRAIFDSGRFAKEVSDICKQAYDMVNDHARATQILNDVANALPGSRELLAARLHAAAFVTAQEAKL